MKKLLIFTGVIMIAYVAVSSLHGGYAVAVQNGTDAYISEGDTKAEIFVITTQNDRVVVYSEGEVYLRTDTIVSQLPKKDRLKLNEGITVFSEKELKELLEDYCS